MVTLLEEDKEIGKTLTEIAESAVEHGKAQQMPTKLVGSYETGILHAVNEAVPIDAVIDSIFDPCKYEVTVPCNYQYEFDLPLELNGPLYCPTWDDWFRTCQVTYIGGHFKGALNFIFEITIGCFGVDVSGCAQAVACLQDVYSDIPGVIVPTTYCAQCSGCAESVEIFGRVGGSDGNCSTGIVIEGSMGCNVPLGPLMAGNFSLNVWLNTPCGISIGG
jgi:hypothetical protein